MDKPHTASAGFLSLVLFAGVFLGGLYILNALRPMFLADPVLELFDQPRALPPAQFRNESGDVVSLSDFRGKVVLLNVWATWCPPCRDEMPSLDRLQRRLGGPRFEVVAVSTDVNGLASVRPFYRRLGIESLAVYTDADAAVERQLGIRGLPTTVLIDRQGRAVGRTLGPADWGDQAAADLIRHQLAGRP